MTPGDARVWGAPAAEPRSPHTNQHGPTGPFCTFFPKQQPLPGDAKSVPPGTTAGRILGAFSDPSLQFCSLIRLVLNIPRDLGIGEAMYNLSLPTSTVRWKNRNNKIMSI